MSLAKKVACPVVALIVILILAMPVSATAGAVARSAGGRPAGSASWLAWAWGGQSVGGFTARLVGWFLAEISQPQPGAGVGSNGQPGDIPATWPALTTDLERGAGFDPDGSH